MPAGYACDELAVLEGAAAEVADGLQHQRGRGEVRIYRDCVDEVGPRLCVLVAHDAVEAEVGAACVGEMKFLERGLTEAHVAAAAEVQYLHSAFFFCLEGVNYGMHAAAVEAYVVASHVEPYVHVAEVDAMVTLGIRVEVQHAEMAVPDLETFDGEDTVQFYGRVFPA